jgi:poly-gamma-glutamate synthesis protein (capsule biosynthesis protein)
MPSEMAAYSKRGIPGRPGLNGLRVNTQYVVDQQSFDALKRISAMLEVPSSLRPKHRLSSNELLFLDTKFIVGDQPHVKLKANQLDVETNLKAVRNARRQADYVVMCVHSHEVDVDPSLPPTFIKDFARACIDAGADVIVGHGEHALRGIELYQGKPILYSLGDFIIENETVTRIAAEAYETWGLHDDATTADFFDRRAEGWIGWGDPWWLRSAVAEVTFDDGELLELKLHPIQLGEGEPRSQRGRPILADDKLGAQIIDRFQKFSVPFNTQIQFKNGVGIVELNK